ncbi:MAG: DNA repair protein, partial [Archangium sp.]|nr:DNA repair protein [Archangium sp.]
TYNLGDILGGKQDLFALSYLENALSANAVTAPLLTRSTGDLHRVLGMAQGGAISVNELEYGYSAAELNEIVEVTRRFAYVQKTLLNVNQEYIKSASQDDRFRTEPPFKLQGSYRNMGKLAEKIVSAMTESELESLLDAHYASESQTLTTAAEQNLLKLGELRGRLSAEQKTRWEEIKRGFKRVQVQGGSEDDPVVRVTGSIAALGEELGQLKDVVLQAADKKNGSTETVAKLDASAIAPKLDALLTSMQKPRPPAVDLGPRLDALRDAVNKLATLTPAPQPIAAPQVDLGPVLEKLTEAVAHRPAPAVAAPPPQLDLGPVLQQLAQNAKLQAQSSESEGHFREEMTQQLLLIQERLSELALSARTVLQADSDGSVKAMTVWNMTKEALELLKALPSRGRKPKR